MTKCDVTEAEEEFESSYSDRIMVLGCNATAVTIYRQQVRAIKLADLLCNRLSAEPPGNNKDAEKETDCDIAIVGAGIGGVTCAARLLEQGRSVLIVDESESSMSKQRHSHRRFVHPHIYDWPKPGSDQRQAGLPIMDWRADYASAVVARQLDPEWHAIRTNARSRAQVHLGIRNVAIHCDAATSPRVLWTGSRHLPHGLARVRYVVLATGFGRDGERDRSYWDDLALDSTTGRWFLSGTGDGGLTDLLRLSIRTFRHDRMLDKLLVRPDYREIARKAAEAQVKPSPCELTAAFCELIKHLKPPLLDVEERRSRVNVILNNRSDPVLSPRSSALNNLFAAAVLYGDGSTVEYRAKPISIGPGENLLTSVHRPGDAFDNALLRQGTAKPEVTVVFDGKVVGNPTETKTTSGVISSDRHLKPTWIPRAFVVLENHSQEVFCLRLIQQSGPPHDEGPTSRIDVWRALDTLRLEPDPMLLSTLLDQVGAFVKRRSSDIDPSVAPRIEDVRFVISETYSEAIHRNRDVRDPLHSIRIDEVGDDSFPDFCNWFQPVIDTRPIGYWNEELLWSLQIVQCQAHQAWLALDDKTIEKLANDLLEIGQRARTSPFGRHISYLGGFLLAEGHRLQKNFHACITQINNMLDAEDRVDLLARPASDHERQRISDALRKHFRSNRCLGAAYQKLAESKDGAEPNTHYLQLSIEHYLKAMVGSQLAERNRLLARYEELRAWRHLLDLLTGDNGEDAKRIADDLIKGTPQVHGYFWAQSSENKDLNRESLHWSADECGRQHDVAIRLFQTDQNWLDLEYFMANALLGASLSRTNSRVQDEDDRIEFVSGAARLAKAKRYLDQLHARNGDSRAFERRMSFLKRCGWTEAA